MRNKTVYYSKCFSDIRYLKLWTKANLSDEVVRRSHPDWQIVRDMMFLASKVLKAHNSKGRYK